MQSLLWFKCDKLLLFMYVFQIFSFLVNLMLMVLWASKVGVPNLTGANF